MSILAWAFVMMYVIGATTAIIWAVVIDRDYEDEEDK